jgi:uncharacterized membrane protein YfcA
LDSLASLDPLTFAVLMLAAAVTGLAKGGLAGVGVAAVPVLALVLPPVQAAGILLPVLCVTDLAALRAWWGRWSARTLALMLPGAMAGIGVGWLTAALVSDDAVRLIVGGIAVAFVARWLWQRRGGRPERLRPESPARAGLWGGLAGYTSFVAHAGGPPFSVYALPLGLSPVVLTGTSVAFFAVVNYVKLIPYFALGQFDGTNLAASALMLPVAILFTGLGAAIIRRMRAELFYPFTYAMTAVVGLKLIRDGLAGL